MLEVSIIKCLTDNYSYLIRDKKTNLVGVVDPSEFETVDIEINKNYKKLDFILNTHHHFDHVGGNQDLKKKYSLKVIINDLSNVVTNKKLNDVWKTKLEKKALKFSSLLSWIFYFNKIKKERIIIFNHIQTSNLNSFIINFLIKASKLPIMFYDEASPFPKARKNIHFFLYKINVDYIVKYIT